ncbi:N-acetylmuramoyl-L-alanine amidase [Clostridium disporicum]|uniref:Peptidoglycan hydrolase n=1 Tax=Clostridium disporicum TaxID=84024 RepID=A0A174BGT3_9CLOT|nr:N-acetylmuramoyl-L-alanine amidase [Clostridium disporicum]CUN98960.1 peptidoglycan hydrolase [Clostridium disporicum]
MKIAVRGGHCPNVPGSSALIDELTEDRLVKNAVIKYLKQLGINVLDVTPPDTTSTSSSDLSYGVNEANNWGADLFVSIHFNNAYSSYNGALGTEVCVYSEYDTAKRVVNKMASLGFKNRGQKVRTGLYELRHTSMKSMIVEVCFVEATEDVALYKKLGYDKIGKTIAEAIVNSSTNSTDSTTPEPTPSSPPTTNYDSWVARLQEECNKQGFSNQKVDGIAGPNTLNGCPMLKQGARGNITKLLQEKLGISADGIFGANTKAAVISYQKANGLSADGIVGPNTWKKLLGL